MSARKNALDTFPIFDSTTGTAMTGTATLTSNPTVLKYLDNVCIDLGFTGTPNGTFTVQTSLDYNPAQPTLATWRDLTLSAVPMAVGVADNHQIFLNQVSFYAVRVKYVNTSGTGVLSGKIAAKMV